MRRLLALLVGATLAASIALPATAKKPVRDGYESVSANAFWYTNENLGGGSTRTTVWYVGVYKSGIDVFADLYEDVYVCDAAENCTTESSRFGYSDLSDGTFTIDSADLTAAHIDAVFDLQAYDENWEPVGDPEPTHIVADWTGDGDLMKGRGSFTWKQKCFSYRERFRDASRSAEATGMVGTMDLGETYDAWLSAGSTRYFEHSC